MVYLMILPAILTAVGDILIGLAVFKVHEKLSEERKIDKEVLKEMRSEKKFVITGIAFIILGLVIDSYYKVIGFYHI